LVGRPESRGPFLSSHLELRASNTVITHILVSRMESKSTLRRPIRCVPCQTLL
jgi:hypothetical protein